MTQTITGLFDTRREAEMAVERLVQEHGLDRNRIRAHVVWFSGEDPLSVQKPYRIKHATRHANATVTRILHKIDVNTLVTAPTQSLAMNDIGLVEICRTGVAAMNRGPQGM